MALALFSSLGPTIQASASEFTLRVDGLACPFCAYGIEKKLLRVSGIEKLDILIDEGKVVLSWRPGAALDLPALHKAVQDAGFTLRSLIVDQAPGELSRDAAGNLVLRSLDPSVTFKVQLSDPASLHWASEHPSMPVIASGTVREFTGGIPVLIASQIVPRSDCAEGRIPLGDGSPSTCSSG